MPMTVRKFVLLPLLVVLPGLVVLTATPVPQDKAAVEMARGLALTAKMPVDQNITIGRFPNGLRYYVRTNKTPLNRAELRLAVNAGSVLEDPDQLGLAHFVEHMAFNGTKHFPHQDLVGFMESIGMRLGPSVNAGTGFDQTIYMLQLPTDKPELLQKAFLILADWAQDVSFDPVEIDKERGVIVEEWRLGRGAGARMRDKQYPVLLKGSRYADRLPIGKKEIIESFKPETLKRFYADWYRPDLMAVIAVGDFDGAAVEGLIKQNFAGIPVRTSPRVRPGYPVPDHPDTLYAIATDKEAANVQLSIYNKLPLRDQTTVGSYRQKIVERLYAGMINNRLMDITRKPEAPFVMAAAGRGIFVQTKEAAMLNAIPKEGAVERALDTLLLETARVARFGFTATELERQKGAVLRTYERYFAEKDKHESATLAAEYIRNFTQNETLPGPALELALHQRFLPEITLDEVNRVAKDWAGQQSRVVMLSAPEKAGTAVPTEAALAAVVKGSLTKEVAPYVDTVAGMVLMDKLPEPGKIVKTAAKEAYGITEWDLSNGVKVVLKPNDYKQDEIVFRATSPGGTSLASDADYVSATMAAQVPSVCGLGRFSATDLRKVLEGKLASVRPAIGDVDEGLTGTASPKDLETMFQLIALHFSAPRADQAAFDAFKLQGKAVLANQQASPDYAFAETLANTLSQNHFRARMMSPALIDEISLDKAMAFYKDRFADASDFTFVFVGNFTLDVMRPLVERYLASLPSTGRKETWKDVGPTPPNGVVEKTVRKGLEPKSTAAIVFTGPFLWNRDQRVAIRALQVVLEQKLRDTIREELGGTYGISASPTYSKIPKEVYSIRIQWGCNPDRTEELVKVVLREVEALKANGPTEKQVNDTRAALIRDFETNVRQNAYLVGQIYLRYQVPEDLGEFFGLGEYYKTADLGKLVWDAARRYLDTGNYVKVTLFPEKPPAISNR
jgi:zinc protease